MKTANTLPENPMRGIWILLSGYKGTFFFAIACLGIAVAGETGGMLLLRYFIDTVIVGGRWDISLALLAGSFLAIALIRGILSFYSGKASAHASEMVTRSIRDRLFDHIQRLSFAYHDKTKTGELIQRATSDVDSLRRFYSEQTKGFARIGFLFAINFSAIAVLNWRLSLISIAVVPLIIWSSWFFYKRIHDAYESYQEQDGKLSSVLQENLSGVRIVRAFARRKFEEQKFEQENKEKFDRGIRFMKSHASYWPVSETIGGLQLLGGIIAAGIMVSRGNLTIGTFVAYVGMAKGIIWPLQQLGRLIAQISTTTVSYKRLTTILNEAQEDTTVGFDEGKGRLIGNIIFKAVKFEYEKDIPVLHNVDLACKAGERIALLGEPGSGKTTLVNLLPRFYDHHSGEIEIDGKPIQEYSRHYLRRNIGIVEQEPFLFSTDIRNNITYGVERKVSQIEVEQAAEAAAIHESIASFPQGYATIVGEKGVTLSGGQKQRIAIARTLLKDPAILILDDSTSAVDAGTEESIRSALNELMKDRTTFIIAHRVQSLMTADQIVVFKEGDIIQQGTHEELIQKHGFYAKVFEMQTRIETEL
ncbi:MAG: ABC transporter ATP-binding protein, partial [Spirochaetales bacterium]|nr:ABC transporter ATP-binding protein [Spirochaetales bacterium]